MSLANAIKRLFGGSESRDDEAEQQEEFGASDRGVADLKERVADPYGGDLGAVSHALEDRPRDPNP
jgi:hypothetical protein